MFPQTNMKALKLCELNRLWSLAVYNEQLHYLKMELITRLCERQMNTFHYIFVSAELKVKVNFLDHLCYLLSCVLDLLTTAVKSNNFCWNKRLKNRLTVILPADAPWQKSSDRNKTLMLFPDTSFVLKTWSQLIWWCAEKTQAVFLSFFSVFFFLTNFISEGNLYKLDRQVLNHTLKQKKV